MDQQQPAVTAADPTPPGFFATKNLVNLAIGVALIGAVCYYLNPLDVLVAAGGLTFIIFIHELGHFLAAKACNVRVETFAIGFGPALPFCSFKYGETTYKLASVPLGGYVKMLGQEDGVVDDDLDSDPRSFKNQSVPERMFIISAGVVMNILLAAAAFVVVYMHGLEETPGEVMTTEVGGAAWRLNVHSGSHIDRIGTRENPWFEDIKPVVWSTDEGETVPLHLTFAGAKTELAAAPRKDDGMPYPVLGVSPPRQLVLRKSRRSEDPPFLPGGPAARPASADGFAQGDRVVAMTDPDADGAVTPVADCYALEYRQSRLAGRAVAYRVERRGGGEATVTVPAFVRKTLGLRMRMGEIVALRAGTPAADALKPGDRITDVSWTAGDGVKVQYSAAPGPGAKPLDPVTLPGELLRWADRTPGTKAVTVTVVRDVDHTAKPVTVTLPWDDLARRDLSIISHVNTPLPVNGLNLCYNVLAVVDAVVPGSPAAAAGLKAGDAVEAVKAAGVDHAGTETVGSFDDIKPHQWAFVDALLYQSAPHRIGLRVKRNTEALEVTVVAVDDPAQPGTDPGLDFVVETRVQKAESVGQALEMGMYRTLRGARTIYMNLYAMAFGRVSFTKTVSGPITLARASYAIAGEDPWKLVLMLAMISINLAVVNFLPIPVLDGGHMMFLAYEGVRGKPAPESVQTVLTYVGLGLVLLMMITVLGLDIWRLILAYFR